MLAKHDAITDTNNTQLSEAIFANLNATFNYTSLLSENGKYDAEIQTQ